MQNEILINNFKSIKHLKQPCTRVNVFIGEPNTGKSNILEAIGFISYSEFYQYGKLRDFIRFTRTTNLFYDEFIDEPFTIKLGTISLQIRFQNGKFLGIVQNKKALLDRLNSQSFDPSRVALFEKEIDCPIGETDSYDNVKVITKRNNEIAFTSFSDSDGVLVLSEVYYPGWKTTIDGKRADTLRVNHALRAVCVTNS